MAEYIDRVEYCENYCRCSNEHCDKESCPIWKAPAADVEPVRHGRWRECFEDWRQQIEGSKCSACGFEYYETGISRFHYCPNCGVKMDGSEE